ncbi:hypothetical protein [Jannaschia sp. R86511]|uniref:hypothetical protein n=1 Tax=Jannaschia sp. R86511 TaxID=3093853 RepID=UPI0036D39A17
MTANDVVMIQTMLDRSRLQVASLLPTEHHNFWVAEQYLKHYNLSHEELLAGIVDGERDCGIDAIYLFVNGVHVSRRHSCCGSRKAPEC